jgi:hypothetical protein
MWTWQQLAGPQHTSEGHLTTKLITSKGAARILRGEASLAPIRAFPV